MRPVRFPRTQAQIGSIIFRIRSHSAQPRDCRLGLHDERVPKTGPGGVLVGVYLKVTGSKVGVTRT